MNNNQITNLAPPTARENAASEQYVDEQCLSVFGTNKMLASLDVDKNNAINLPDNPVDDTAGACSPRKF